MPLYVHSHAHVERLAQALADDLAAAWPDPFALMPVVVGSRGMERWLRHQLATAHGLAANLAFPFPRQALDGLAMQVLGHHHSGPWWQPNDDAAAWRAERLMFPVLQALRARSGQPTFAAASAYLEIAADDGAAVSARQWSFARQVADVLDKLMHDRHREALRWARVPDSAGDHAWLATLLRDVQILDDQSPARVRERLEQLAPATADAQRIVLRLFCLSSLGPADRALLVALARHVDVVLYTLAPSYKWWTDLRNRRESARDLAQATDEAERSRLLKEIDSQNALLAQLGTPSRDMQAWIEAQDYRDGICPTESHGEAASALDWLQRWVGDAAAMDTTMPTALADDGSIEVLACWGALRQVEVLRDRLLELFQRPGSDLAPRDVLVMTPDVECFAPLVAAVFARRTQSRSVHGGAVDVAAIPVHIADLGLRRTNPVAEALLAVLALCEGRVSAPQLVDVLELEAVQTRLGLQGEDVSDLRDLVRASGMRWAFDAADRGAAGQPTLDQNTLEFGLERLACGVLMAPVAAGELARLDDRDLSPMPVESAERARRVAALARLLRAVRAARQRQSQATAGRSVSQWRHEWSILLSEFTATSDAAAWLGAQVHSALDALVAEASAWPGQLTLGAIRRALAGRFEMPVRGDRPITGAVTVCALQPMRSVPFRVIALLGMDDGAFPSTAAPQAWDPFAAPQRGELDGRLVQRHLLLETLLSARERLLVFYDGHGKQPKDHKPAAVPVEELVDVLARLSKRDREAWVTQTTLQPWDPAAFSDARAPFDDALAQAATQLTAAAHATTPLGPLGLGATVAENCPPEDTPPASVGLRELAEGLAAPQKLFIEQRLRIRLPRDRQPLADREPLELDNLDVFEVRKLILADRGLRAGDPNGQVAQRVTRRLAAEGQLPLAARGAEVVAQQVETVRKALDAFGFCQGEPVDPPLLAVDLRPAWVGGAHLLRAQGTPAAVQRWRDGLLLQWLVPNSAPKAEHELAAWLHLLAAQAVGLPVVGARVMGVGGIKGNQSALAGVTMASGPDPATAQTMLTELARTWLAARARPQQLFSTTSKALAESVAADDPLGRTQRKVDAAWHGTENSPGERAAQHVAALFGRFDPAAQVADPRSDGVRDLAVRVWLPLVRACKAGESLAKDWHRADGGRA